MTRENSNPEKRKPKRGHGEGRFQQLPSGNWRVEIMIRGRRFSKTFPTKKAGQAWIRELQNKDSSGLDLTSERMTVRTLIENWLPKHIAAKKSRPATIQQYKIEIQKHILPRLGDVKLKDVNPLLVDQFLETLQDEGVGDRTRQVIHTILNVAFKWAVKKKLLSYNPVANADRPTYQKKKATLVLQEDDELPRFFAALRGRRLAALYVLAIATGLREGELIGLKWSNLSWDTKTLTVNRQIQWLSKKALQDDATMANGVIEVSDQGWYVGLPKTDNGLREIRLGDDVIAVLRLHIARMEQELRKIERSKRRSAEEKEKIISQWRNLDLMFPSMVGTPLNPSNLIRDFKQVLEIAGLPQRDFHDTRHSGLSILVNHNVPISTVSERGGHADITTTLNIYTHPMRTSQEIAAQVMDQVMNLRDIYNLPEDEP